MKNKIIGFFLILILLGGGIGYLILQYSYSNGNRAGKLVKISRKGFFPKTYEGTLDLGSGDKLTWEFSVHDDELGANLEKQSGKMVVLEYREVLWRFFYGTTYDVISWKLQPNQGNDGADLCRLVDVLRKDKNVVEQVRPMIMEHDPSLLEIVRECQN